MPYSNQKMAGTFLLFGSLEFLFGLQVAEFFDPGYSVSQNYISDLGANCTSGVCQIVQPTSTIFDSTIVVLGLMIVAGAYFIHREFHTRLFAIPLALSGIGAMGVGIFPETAGSIHSVMALIAFLFGGLAAILSYKVERKPLSYFSTVLGLITLVALILYTDHIYFGLGPGGMQRMVAYPALFWGVALGGHLIHHETEGAVGAPLRSAV